MSKIQIASPIALFSLALLHGCCEDTDETEHVDESSTLVEQDGDGDGDGDGDTATSSDGGTGSTGSDGGDGDGDGDGGTGDGDGDGGAGDSSCAEITHAEVHLFARASQSNDAESELYDSEGAFPVDEMVTAQGNNKAAHSHAVVNQDELYLWTESIAVDSGIWRPDTSNNVQGATLELGGCGSLELSLRFELVTQVENNQSPGVFLQSTGTIDAGIQVTDSDGLAVFSGDLTSLNGSYEHTWSSDGLYEGFPEHGGSTIFTIPVTLDPDDTSISIGLSLGTMAMSLESPGARASASIRLLEVVVGEPCASYGDALACHLAEEGCRYYEGLGGCFDAGIYPCSLDPSLNGCDIGYDPVCASHHDDSEGCDGEAGCSFYDCAFGDSPEPLVYGGCFSDAIPACAICPDVYGECW